MSESESEAEEEGRREERREKFLGRKRRELPRGETWRHLGQVSEDFFDGLQGEEERRRRERQLRQKEWPHWRSRGV